jgi:hypothetical protein
MGKNIWGEGVWYNILWDVIPAIFLSGNPVLCFFSSIEFSLLRCI